MFTLENFWISEIFKSKECSSSKKLNLIIFEFKYVHIKNAISENVHNKIFHILKIVTLKNVHVFN
jgi:hypothetical protein